MIDQSKSFITIDSFSLYWKYCEKFRPDIRKIPLGLIAILFFFAVPFLGSKMLPTTFHTAIARYLGMIFVIALGVLGFLLFWLVFAFLEYYFFYRGEEIEL